MAKFLDSAGITYLISKLKTIFASKEDSARFEILKCQIGQIPPSTSNLVPLADLSKLTYSAGQQFNQFLIPFGQNQKYARFQGYIITGSNTCIVNPSFKSIIAGGGSACRQFCLSVRAFWVQLWRNTFKWLSHMATTRSYWTAN